MHEQYKDSVSGIIFSFLFNIQKGKKVKSKILYNIEIMTS